MADVAETVSNAVPQTTDACLASQQTLEVSTCPGCGYALRVAGASQCPECGAAVDVAAIKRWQMPWQSAKGLGHLWAFVKTVWRVTVCRKQTAWAAHLPVDLKKARWFRRWVCLWMWLVLVLLAWAPLVANDAYEMETLWENLPHGLVWLWVVGVAGGLWLWVQVLTGAHLWSFHPKDWPMEQQNRTAHLAHYACGAWVWLLLAVALGRAGLWLLMETDYGRFYEDELTGPLRVLPLVWFALVGGLVLRVVWRWMRLAVRRPWLNRAGWAAGVVLAWLLSLVVLVGVLPVLLVWAVTMVQLALG